MTTANKLTIFRIILVPFFAYFLWTENWWISLAVFVVASLTDLLDGYIARKYNQITDLGKLLDPLADKILMLSAFTIFALTGMIPWWGFSIIAAREAAVTLLREVAKKEGKVIAASIWGKLKTVTQIVSVILFICFANFRDDASDIGAVAWRNYVVMLQDAVFYVAVAITLMSGLDYIVKYVRGKKTLS